MKQSLPGLLVALLLVLLSTATTALASATAVASAPAPEYRQWIVDYEGSGARAFFPAALVLQ